MSIARSRPIPSGFTIRVAAPLTVIALGVSCAAPSGGGMLAPGADADVVVTLHPAQTYQTIHGFGASDAWSIQFVGENWPDAKRDRIADLLFSSGEREDGSAIGIGLSAWRFNIGAGSARQGAESGIRDRWRRAPSFMRDEGSLDPDAQPGQRAFLRAARDRGVDQFYAFVNSPPVPLTRNGRAFSSGGSAANLSPERYADFAAFLRDVLLTVRQRDGIEFDFVSPFNEPQWDWDGGQEGSPWLNSEIAAVVRQLSGALQDAGVSTRIEVAETARYNYLYEVGDKPGRGAQARAFFDPSSPDYLGALPNVARRVAAHSYFTTYPADTLRAVRRRVHEELQAIDPALELILSEYCILENSPVIRGGGRDLGMDAALYMAGVIHSDLVDAHASGWHWWLAVSPYDYKDGLVYIDHDSIDGEVYDSKMLWALGQYSRFVRPGMQRIGADLAVDGASEAGADAEILVSAYRDPGTSRIAVVLTNRGANDRTVGIAGLGSGQVQMYRTSDADGDDLRHVGSAAVVEAEVAVELPARSLVTLVSGR